MDIYKSQLIQDSLKGIIDQKLGKTSEKNIPKLSLDQFFPNIDLNKLEVLIKRISQEKSVSLADLDKYTRRYIQQNNKILSDMHEEDLIEIVALLLKDRDQQNTTVSTFYSPFEFYAQNYLQIIEKQQDEMLQPEQIYSTTNRVDREISQHNEETRKINREDKRLSLHNKLANLEIDAKHNFSSVESLRKTKAEMIEAGFAI